MSTYTEKPFDLHDQLKEELNDYFTSKIVLARTRFNKNDVRTITAKGKGAYRFNMAETLGLIDMYANSQFESGPTDTEGNEKLFLNVGTFRTEVAAKQIDIDVKDFRFLPDDYANTWPAFFMQKRFQEYAKETYFGEIVNRIVDDFPKYGSIVVKRVGKKLEIVPLQNIRIEQSAPSIAEARYFIEEHPDMPVSEIRKMKLWKTDKLNKKDNECLTVYERYAYVPIWWLRNQGVDVAGDDSTRYVDAMVVCAFVDNGDGGERTHVFYATDIDDRDAYQEAHWRKQHGRWLGIGTMEEQFPNQNAKNIIVNLYRKGLAWSVKHVFQGRDLKDVKNLATDVNDGDILEVGANGELNRVDLTSKAGAEFTNFLQEFEKNSDQKAFTYEVATGETMPSNTPATLGVILNQATNSYFQKKREALGLFLKRCVNEFLIPDFKADMRKKDIIVNYFSDEPGFEALKSAAMDYIRSEATKASLMAGVPVDAQTLVDAVQPFEAVRSLFFKVTAGQFDDVQAKFDLSLTGEETDVRSKMQSLSTLYTVLMQQGDVERANRVAERMSALAGINIDTFGLPKPTPQQPVPTAAGGQAPNLTPQGEQTPQEA